MAGTRAVATPMTGALTRCRLNFTVADSSCWAWCGEGRPPSPILW